IGRPWPLLAGERAHYELAAGRRETAVTLLNALENSAGPGGLLPEQVWDSDDIRERELFRGCPSGSAMPLVWAHAEHIKLLRSLRDGAVFDMPPQGVARYVAGKTRSRFQPWRFNNKVRAMPSDKTLRIELFAPATVHWSADGWKTAQDTPTHENGFGLHVAELSPERLHDGTALAFTFYWPEAGHWENSDFSVAVVAATG
ncbi:MAG: glucan 1,4-alpha-glucosidase, partial [Pararhizobium sp.]